MAKSKKELIESTPGRSASFLRLERNLNIIGFFSASKKRGTQARTIEAKRQVDGKTYVAKTTILPSPEHGLPNTSDQDKYFALMHLVNQIKMRVGVVKNPITFTSSDLVRILGLSWSGDIGHEIRTWLERLVATTIKSEGSIYLPQRKRYMSDTYHAFDRVIISGDELPNGVISESHQVFFSEWLLESFNRNYVFPIEMEGYRKLKSPLAKTLVPHLQIWLYASRSIRRFEKRYSDICVICDIEVCKYLSHIKRQLEMSMEELRAGGYIAAWDVETTADGRDFKVVLEHGAKFFSDQLLLSGREEPSKAAPDELPPVYQALLDRRITPAVARKLCKSLSDEQLRVVMNQVEYCDWVVANSRGRLHNPPGFYVTFLRNNDPVPEDFVGSSQAAMNREAEELRRQADQRNFLLGQEYDDHISAEIDRLVALLPQDEIEAHRESFRKQVKKEYPFMPQEHAKALVQNKIRLKVRQESSLPSFDEFCRNRSPQLGFSF
jgi:hypothetical protein